MTLSLRIYGIPAPQGSKSAYVRNGRAVIVEGSSAKGREAHKAWRKAVTECATKAIEELNEWPPLQSAAVSIVFFMPRPKSAAERIHHTTKPDLDKLVRAVLDALTDAQVFVDDARVHTLAARKVYERANEPSGAHILVFDNNVKPSEMPSPNRFTTFVQGINLVDSPSENSPKPE